jgi:hypothetical protein
VSHDCRVSPESRHVAVWVAANAPQVYAFAVDPHNLPAWAAGLASGEVRPVDEAWAVSSPMGDVTVEFAPRNAFGVLDHVVALPDGQEVYNPMRVIPAGGGQAGCEVVFTVRRRDGMTDEEFDADIAAVAADLQTLKALLER